MENLCYQMAINLRDLNQRNLENSQLKREVVQRATSYKCTKCNDTGWILVLQDTGNPIAKSCECRESEKLKNQWKAAGINIEFAKQTFGNYKTWNDSSKKAKDVAIAFYNDFKGKRKNRQNSIVLCGQVGSGKTHLSIALALNLINKNIKVVYMPYRDVITRIKQNMLDDEYYRKTLSKYQRCDVLLIDDLFKGKINEADINIIFEIINYRYLNYLPIIVSTEFTIERLLNFDESIGSRIYEMCKSYIVEISKNKDNNYRLK